MRTSLRRLGGCLALGVLSAGAGQVQAAPDQSVMYQHIMQARQIAGQDLKFDFYHRCFVDPNYSDTIAKQRKQTADMAPVKVFDQLYFVGQNAVSSWVLKTSDGLILFDTENNPDEAKKYIVAGMERFGLDPKAIRYIVITHEHADHFGGASYMKSIAPNARILASAVAWANMPKPTTRRHDLAPSKGPGDQDIRDGEKLTLGDTTLAFYITPGHTDGTVSTIFHVTDHGRPHVVGFFGGMGSPHTEANRDKIISSFARWAELTQAAGVDTLVANHQVQDHAVEFLEFLKVRRPDDPNPFVLGKTTYQRYFQVQSECTKAALARNGERIPQ